MKLSDRKLKILKAVARENIDKAEPVSSKEVQEKYMPDVSSATIRNELMALEQMGYLSQPHTSAGRVPTALGFRMFIEEILPNISMSKSEVRKLKENITERVNDLEDVVKIAAEAISSATELPSVVFSGITEDAVIRTVKIVKITEQNSLVVVVTDAGVIKDVVIDSSNLNESAYEDASKILSGILENKKIKEVAESEELVAHEFMRFKAIFAMLLNVLQSRKKDMAVEGVSKLLHYSEFHDLQKAKNAVSLIEDRQALAEVLDNGGIEIAIKIGETEGLENCAIVSATIKHGDNKNITAGVIGPMRMDYEKIFKVLKNVGHAISEASEERDK